jgi:uncharacterized glyoxalase superfamily protein PhnB
MPNFDRRELAVLTVELFVPDVDASVRFYTEHLGFELLRVEPEGEAATFAVVALGGAVILIAHESLAGGVGLTKGSGHGLSVRVMVDDVDAVYQRVRDLGVDVVAEIGDRYYGLRDFSILDCDGIHLRFASPSRV